MKQKYNLVFVCLVFLFSVLTFPHNANSATAQELKDRYSDFSKTKNPIRILIVPGHDNEYWGTEYRGIREADLNLYLAQQLHSLLKKDPRFSVTITRTWKGYAPEFENYFKNQKDQIIEFSKEKRRVTSEQIVAGVLKAVESVPHNNANSDTAVRLYGINKWANENNIDLVLHVHFNDTPSRKYNMPGEYSGITVYIPESQYSNAKVSKEFGQALYSSLSALYSPSTMPQESGGLVEDQTLIAIGASNTLTSAASALVEYGYIYEPQFLDYTISNAVMDDLAFQTFLGLHDFFGDKTKYIKSGTSLLPHTWKKAVPQKALYNLDVLALQAALRKEKLFPAAGFSSEECGMTGHFNACTVKSLKAFQKKYGIEQTGTLGPKTRAKLNKLFGR